MGFSVRQLLLAFCVVSCGLFALLNAHYLWVKLTVNAAVWILLAYIKYGIWLKQGRQRAFCAGYTAWVFAMQMFVGYGLGIFDLSYIVAPLFEPKTSANASGGMTTSVATPPTVTSGYVPYPATYVGSPESSPISATQIDVNNTANTAMWSTPVGVPVSAESVAAESPVTQPLPVVTATLPSGPTVSIPAPSSYNSPVPNTTVGPVTMSTTTTWGTFQWSDDDWHQRFESVFHALITTVAGIFGGCLTAFIYQRREHKG